MPVADVAVIGGGVVGLAIAYEFLQRNPSYRVVVFDKEADLAAHASGRNSGVLHAGFYYAPDSLKARLTRLGNELLHAFLDDNGVEIRRCGKVVVAANEEQLPQLMQLYNRGKSNGVPLELVDEAQLREIEPAARTVGNALWSPTTSVSDPRGAVEALAAQVRARSGLVEMSCAVSAARAGRVVARRQSWSVGHVVNAAGLQADRVARWFDMCDDYVVLPFKGLYWYSDRPLYGLRRHIYPVPDPRNPFLGVHLTMTLDGRVKVGPSAIPALWRESYGGTSGFNWQDVADMARHFPGFLRSPHHDALGLVRTELPKYRRRHMIAKAAVLAPQIRADDFKTKGRVGVRAQLFHLPTKKLELDFVIRGDDKSTHVLNAVSPAWTSSLAVAQYVVDDISARASI